jgi:hypothetical protein
MQNIPDYAFDTNSLEEIIIPNNIITIGNKKYVIADVQWTSGDWKIDLKT